jgi:Holliday junction resolvase RusA-like endonuclease
LGLSFTFVVLGKPATQGSKTYLGGGRMVESSKRLALWRADARLAAARAVPDGWNLAAPVQVNAVFSFARPKAHYGSRRGQPYLKPAAPAHCAVRADVDKLCRALLDAITGPVVLDDSQVTVLIAQKRWSCDGTESTSATVTALHAPDCVRDDNRPP